MNETLGFRMKTLKNSTTGPKHSRTRVTKCLVGPKSKTNNHRAHRCRSIWMKKSRQNLRAIWHRSGWVHGGGKFLRNSRRMRGMVCGVGWIGSRSEEHTSELQSRFDLVCRLLLEKKQYRTDV